MAEGAILVIYGFKSHPNLTGVTFHLPLPLKTPWLILLNNVYKSGLDRSITPVLCVLCVNIVSLGGRIIHFSLCLLVW